MSYQRSLQEIIDTISSETGIQEEEIRRLIDEKIEELGDFVTELGAAHIVLRELQREDTKEKHETIFSMLCA